MAFDDQQSNAPATGEAVQDFFSTDEIFLRVAASADEEFSRSTRLLFLSGLAAGLSIGLSFMARAALTAQSGSDLVGNLVYPIGFLLIVLGRYQLFTENTLTPVTLVLTRIASLPLLLRNWGIVLTANVIGAMVMGFVLSASGILEPDALAVAREIGLHALELDFGVLFVRGIVAGWIVASMVWLIHAARDTISRLLIVFFLMFLIPSTDLFHCIIGACEAFFLVFDGDATLSNALLGFFLPVLLGNTLGGVLLVAILNFAQTRDTRFPDRNCGVLELSWREWLFGFHTGHPLAGRSLRLDARDYPDVPLVEPVNQADHVRGPQDAPYTLVQYGDYECPTSQEIHELIQDVTFHLDYKPRVAFRHLPLRRQHEHAELAALAAEAAGNQGRFWEMHDMLFERQTQLTRQDLLNYARQLDLAVEQFTDDLDNKTGLDRIEADIESAKQSGARSTDNLFINNQRYTGKRDLASVLNYLRSLEIEVGKDA